MNHRASRQPTSSPNFVAANMPLPLTQLEKKILAVLAALIVLGLIGFAVL